MTARRKRRERSLVDRMDDLAERVMRDYPPHLSLITDRRVFVDYMAFAALRAFRAGQRAERRARGVKR